jgi:hypothetical protein
MGGRFKEGQIRRWVKRRTIVTITRKPIKDRGELGVKGPGKVKSWGFRAQKRPRKDGG